MNIILTERTLFQEPVIKPVWNTFASSLSGIWKGVGAVFSPITAEMEPIEISNRNENLYDCYTLSRIEAVPSLSGAHTSQIQRKVNWVTLNPYGEIPHQIGGRDVAKDGSNDLNAPTLRQHKSSENITNHVLPTFESFDFERSDVMEEDIMSCEPGLVYFEDGSYSRGPIDIPVGEDDDTNYYITPTFKFEQCLVKGCHKRIRIVHTIEFSNGGSDIQIMRVAVYEEEWVRPASVDDQSDMEFDLKPFSQRKRTKPSELIGSWKVFEVSATPVYGEETEVSTPYVYLCTETLKKRSLPENTNYFGEEERLDMQDVTMLWLPGGVTCYVDINKDGILCIGVGWYSDEGINLVMERDYGLDGKLKEVRWKSEVKRRWSNPPNE
ncbi:Calycin [Sesbania bispinosa]|nr:Calycin [Sesbania bispinosa]